MSLKSKDILHAWAAFFEAHAFSVQRVEEELSGKAPLTLHEYDVLLTVSRAMDKRIRYSELAALSVFTKSGITRVAKRLEKRGLIVRRRCEQDARGAYAVLTKEGASALRETWELYSKTVLGIFAPALSHEEANELERLMEKIISQLKPAPLVSIGSS